MEKLQELSIKILSPREIDEFLESLLILEVKQDFESQSEIFSAVWNDFDHSPSLDSFSEIQRALFLRIAGRFILKYGESKNIFNYIERGREFLGQSERCFADNGKPDDAAHAHILTGFAFWVEKQYEEYEIFLEAIEENYKDKLENPIFSLIQINWLLHYGTTNQPQKSANIIAKYGEIIENCSNIGFLNQYHNEAGIVCRQFKDYDNAAIHYRKAISISLEIEDFRSVAQRLNNLACLYLSSGETILALNCANESIQIYESSNDFGWLGPGYDTKAQVLYAQEKYSESLAAIDISIEHFENCPLGRDLTDALFLKVKCLLRLHRPVMALFFYEKLQGLASEIGDEISAKRYEISLKKEFAVNIADVFSLGESAPIVRVDRPASDNVRSFIVNQDNLIYLQCSVEFAEKYLFRKDAAMICVEKNSYLDTANLILLNDGQHFFVGEVFYNNGFCFAEDTFSQKTYDLERVRKIGRIVAVSDLVLENDEVLFYEA